MAAKTKELQITTPGINTIYWGHGIKQRARYIQLSKDYEKKLLYDDIKNGASIYDSFEKTLEQPRSRYNIITAPTEEDGLRAVQYLAEIHAADDGWPKDEYSSEAVSMEAEDMDDVFDFSEDDWNREDDDDDYFDDESSFPEVFSRVPIIPIGEVESLEYSRTSISSMGSFSFEMMNSKKQPKPWWLDCTNEAVCIVKNNCGPVGFMSGLELLSSNEIGCLRRFGGNRSVYLVVVGDSIREEDYSINTAMLEYTANCFHVDSKKDKLSGYYRKLLLQQVSSHGFKLSRKMDINLLTDKLSSIDRQFPCAKFEKIMDYFVHVNAKPTLHAVDFSAMGLDKLINTESGVDASGDMDKSLQGMESVKQQVIEIVHMMKYARLRENRGLGGSDFHNVHLFVGAPGTAKTTMARMMTKMMQEEGLLSGDRFISVTGAQLKGAYVGQTAPKVHALFQQYDAIFIDEAYSLASGSEMEGGIDSYAQEALAQLAVELEDYGKNKLVIFAGYGGKNLSKKNNLMHKFLTSNPGISSRICSTIYFDSYTPGEMVSIVHHLAGKAGLSLGHSLDSKIAEYFEERSRESDFGNGREARSFLEQMESSLAERIFPSMKDDIPSSMLNTINNEDIENALQKLRDIHSNQLGEYRNGFGI